MNSTVRIYVATLISVMSWKVALVLALMVCVSVTEGVSLLMLVPLMQSVGLDVGQGTVGSIDGFVSSAFAAINMRPTLIAVLGIYVVVIGLRALLYRWATIAGDDLEQEFVSSLRQRVYRTISNVNWLFFLRNRPAGFTHALTAELERVGDATYYLLSILATAMVTTAYLLLALKLSVAMTSLTFAFGSILILLLRRKVRRARASGEEISSATNSLYDSAIEHFGGMKVTKSYGAQERNAEIFSRLVESVARSYKEATRNGAEVRCWFDIGSVLLLGFALYVALELLAIPAATILLLLYLFARITPRLSSIQENYQHFINALPAFATVTDIQARCEAAAELQDQRSGEIALCEGIRFDQVSFAYDEETPVIRELDIYIRAGETTAIVGSSGAGKSTIADLVMGLLVPSSGQVRVDELPLDAERISSWRDQIGYVAQDTFLFNDTVRANLLWACPEASDEEVGNALRLAAAEGFISALPNGIDTVLGDRGARLSGGQSQRLALARALLRGPSLLILDEATSALDSENENRIQSAIEELHGHMTILVITHRLSTIQSADTIYVLEEGGLVESGDWTALLNKPDGRFKALCRAQGLARAGETVSVSNFRC